MLQVMLHCNMFFASQHCANAWRPNGDPTPHRIAARPRLISARLSPTMGQSAYRPERRVKPEFIFMLTRADRTVANARELLPKVIAAGVGRVGFKDVGLPFEALRDLAFDVRHFGAELYIEVVSLDLESEVESARVAVELGVDWLLGGTRPDAVLPIIAGTRIRYAHSRDGWSATPASSRARSTMSLKVLAQWPQWTGSTASTCWHPASQAMSRR